jgi:hypothetical protein
VARAWLAGTILLTLGSFVAAVALAPGAGHHPEQALVWLLFVGSSMHVASTSWFFTVPQVRTYAWSHPRRYVVVPLVLVSAAAVAAAVTAPGTMRWFLLLFFAWQFFHFQKQNLGLAALAGVSSGAGSLREHERLAITVAGVAGIAALLSHPELLQVSVDPRLRWVFPAAVVVFVGAVGFGAVVYGRRDHTARSGPLLATYTVSLLFFVPVFVFRSPYAAVAGLTVAHGLQYLLIMALVARGESTRARRVTSLVVLVDLALIGGLVLNVFSHQHDAGPWGRALFGVYLGVVMAHFVVDAGLWRLRDRFPRALLGARVPELVGAAARSGPA